MTRMNRLALLALALASLAYAGESLLGTIFASSTTAKNQATTTTGGFTIPKGDHITISCMELGADAGGYTGNAANAYIAWKATDAGVVTAATATHLTAFWETYAGSDLNFLSVLCATATNCSCHVAEAQP